MNNKIYDYDYDVDLETTMSDSERFIALKDGKVYAKTAGGWRSIALPKDMTTPSFFRAYRIVWSICQTCPDIPVDRAFQYARTYTVGSWKDACRDLYGFLRDYDKPITIHA